MSVIDLTQFEKKNTLVFMVPSPDRDEAGEQVVTEWRVPPLTAEQELAIRRIEQDRLKRLNELIHEATALSEGRETDGDLLDAEPESDAHAWAPVVAVAVSEPVLDEEWLKEHFSGMLLKKVGETILNFTLYGRQPEEAEEEKHPRNKKSKLKSAK
jgi:hypothetical protein